MVESVIKCDECMENAQLSQSVRVVSVEKCKEWALAVLVSN